MRRFLPKLAKIKLRIILLRKSISPAHTKYYFKNGVLVVSVGVLYTA